VRDHAGEQPARRGFFADPAFMAQLDATFANL
jgi:hypothetical protein